VLGKEATENVQELKTKNENHRVESYLERSLRRGLENFLAINRSGPNILVGGLPGVLSGGLTRESKETGESLSEAE